MKEDSFAQLHNPCSTKPFMERITDIPDDIVTVYTHPVFQQTRVILHQYIQAVDEKEIGDDTEYMLFYETGPEHVFPELEEGKEGERHGNIDIHIRAPFCETQHIILPAVSHPLATMIDTNIGRARSDAMLETLTIDQRIVVMQFAFAERYDQLRQRMAKRQRQGGSIYPLSHRIVRLYGTYERKLQALMES